MEANVTQISPLTTHKWGLDGMRGIAVVLVILVHWGYLDCGWIGVQMFFVLSGYLITSILLRERQLPAGLYFARFYWRRALRIFPLYYCYLLLLLLAHLTLRPALFEPERRAFGQLAPYLFTYTFNYTLATPGYPHTWFFHHFWSLAIEEQFYLVWPFIVFWLSPQRFRAIALILVLAGPLVRLGTASVVSAITGSPAPGIEAAFAYTFCQIDSLATGSLLASLEASRGMPPRRLCWIAALACPVVALVHGAVLVAAGHGASTSFGFPSTMPWNYQYVWGHTVINVASAGVIGLLSSGAAIGRMFDVAFGHLGRRSYAMYVLHAPLMMLWKRFSGRVLGQVDEMTSFLLFVVSLMIACEVSYSMLEKRFLALKETRFRLPPTKTLAC